MALLAVLVQVVAAEDDTVDREGRIVWLAEAPDNEEFPALYARAVQPRGAIVLLHDLGAFVDDPRLFEPLREQLIGQGYNVFIPRLPISRKVMQGSDLSSLDYDSLLAVIERRARSSIEFMQAEKQQPLLLLGHGYGAFAATMLLGREDAPRVAALVSISPHWYAHPEGQRTYIKTLSNVPVAVLDIYPAVDEEADNRLRSSVHMLRGLALKATEQPSRQVGIPYTDHHMRGMVEPVVRILDNWLSIPGSGPGLLPPPVPGPDDASTVDPSPPAAVGGNAATPPPPQP